MKSSWNICPICKGRGTKSRGLSKKVRLRYQRAVEEFEKRQGEEGVSPPNPPLLHQDPCMSCDASGLVSATRFPAVDNENFPHVAIIGAGIGGMALAVACMHRGIPFTLYERDAGFDSRSQGYGLTLQQASKAIEGLGIFSLSDGVISTRHKVHTTDGNMIGEWGIRKWLRSEKKAPPKRTNIHIARQSLRRAIMEQLGGEDAVQCGHQLVNFKEYDGDDEAGAGAGVELSFEVDGELMSKRADLVVGADGIRSVVRKWSIGDDVSPLNYLGCIVILGICPMDRLDGLESDLLDSATVFQTVNGHERMYMMPYSSDSVMWQFSYPLSEDEARALSERGPAALKEDACRRTQWHAPVPEVVAATEVEDITGYPVYDRPLLKQEMLERSDHVTLIGDAAHPMSPFKGQGANQAILDALSLARGIFEGCGEKSNWRESGIRESVLRRYEEEMVKRTAVKVKDSAEASQFLHSEVVLHVGDEPRGRCLQRKASEEEE